jgi:Mg2+/Co2+ transporter CorB
VMTLAILILSELIPKTLGANVTIQDPLSHRVLRA